MGKYRKKPVVIEAVQWNGPEDRHPAVCTALHNPITRYPFGVTRPHIHTLEGVHRVSPGDWIIRGVKGEFYPCKPDIFEITYEPVEE